MKVSDTIGCIYFIQGSTNRWALGLVNFVPALAYHFCLNMPAPFTQPGARLLVEPCTFSSLCTLASAIERKPSNAPRYLFNMTFLSINFSYLSNCN